MQVPTAGAPDRASKSAGASTFSHGAVSCAEAFAAPGAVIAPEGFGAVEALEGIGAVKAPEEFGVRARARRRMPGPVPVRETLVC